MNDDNIYRATPEDMDDPIDDMDASDGHEEHAEEIAVVCLECGEHSKVEVGEEECPNCGSTDLEPEEEE